MSSQFLQENAVGNGCPPFLDSFARQDYLPRDSVDQFPKQAKVCPPEAQGTIVESVTTIEFRKLNKSWVQQGKIAILPRQTSNLTAKQATREARSEQQADFLQLVIPESHMLFNLSATTLQLSE
ncbi:hypothetical protein QYF61_010652, partial [Mycteria americana]